MSIVLLVLLSKEAMVLEDGSNCEACCSCCCGEGGAIDGDNSKDELQSILQQVQMQISLIAGQDKATNAIKQIESVIELNPNGPLAQ